MSIPKSVKDKAFELYPVKIVEFDQRGGISSRDENKPERDAFEKGYSLALEESLKGVRWDNDFIHAIDILLQEKPKDKSIFKAVEELLELATNLMQYENKGVDNGINEEIVDVSMHIFLLSKMFNVTNEQIRNKVDKFLSSEDYKKYEQSYSIKVPESSPKEEEESELSNALEWLVTVVGALQQLVEVKMLKDREGKTPEYEERQPKAWHLAFEVMELLKKDDGFYKKIQPAPPQSDFQIAWQLSQTTEKPFFIDSFRQLIDRYELEEISLSKIVEVLNVAAFKWRENAKGAAAGGVQERAKAYAEAKVKTYKNGDEWEKAIVATEIKKVYLDSASAENEELKSHNNSIHDLLQKKINENVAATMENEELKAEVERLTKGLIKMKEHSNPKELATQILARQIVL
jgi:NTP pyrophosphatase (non-canonical NTP hydrolase)